MWIQKRPECVPAPTWLFVGCIKWVLRYLCAVGSWLNTRACQAFGGLECWRESRFGGGQPGRIHKCQPCTLHNWWKCCQTSHSIVLPFHNNSWRVGLWEGRWTPGLLQSLHSWKGTCPPHGLTIHDKPHALRSSRPPGCTACHSAPQLQTKSNL